MEDSRRPLLEHLEELRRRLLVVVVVVLAASAGCWAVSDRILDLMASPVGGFVFLRPAEAFLVRLKVSFFAGALAAAPVILYQAWSFVAVALTLPERRAVLRMLPFSYLLFAAGAGLAWTVVIPAAARFLLSFATPELRPMVSVEAYLEFAAWLTLGFGILFQLPLAVLLLVRAGLATPADLAAWRRQVLLGLAVAAAVLTPGPDLFSQLALLAPTYLLYEASIWISRATASAPEPADAAAAAAE